MLPSPVPIEALLGLSGPVAVLVTKLIERTLNKRRFAREAAQAELDLRAKVIQVERAEKELADAPLDEYARDRKELWDQFVADWRRLTEVVADLQRQVDNLRAELAVLRKADVEKTGRIVELEIALRLKQNELDTALAERDVLNAKLNVALARLHDYDPLMQGTEKKP